MELFLEAIKEFNYKEIWFNRIKNGDFIDYFCSVDNEERKYLECYYMLFLKNNCESLEDEDVIILNYIDTKIDELLNRSKKELLSFEEIKFLSDFLGNLLLYNKEVSEDKIVCYVNNCYLHNKELGLGTDLVILLKYVFDYLNNYNNANIKFMLKSRNFMGGDFANFVINMETLEKKVFVVREYYDNFIDKYDSVPLKTFNYMLVFQTASLLHEFMHYKQSGLNFRKPLTEEEDILRRELDLIWEDSSFYKKKYKLLKTEKDANEFSIRNLDYFIKGLVLDEYYEDVMDTVIGEFNDCISEVNIIDLVKMKYKKYIKKR